MLAMLSIHMLGVLNMEGLQGNSLQFSCCELSNKLWSMLGVRVFKSILNVPCITQDYSSNKTNPWHKTHKQAYEHKLTGCVASAADLDRLTSQKDKEIRMSEHSAACSGQKEQ